jgi:hypothetical protein
MKLWIEASRVGAALVIAVGLLGASSDPYSSVTPEQKSLLKPVVERYLRDQIHQDWADLWIIQDQSSDLKNELLLGRRDAPDLSKQEFISAMNETIGTGYPRLRSFELREVRADKNNFIMIGCGYATREEWKQKGIIIAGIRISEGQPKVDLWSMTSDACS